MKKIRIDTLVVESGLAESRSLAQKMIMAGEVRAEGNIVFKPSQTYSPGIMIEIINKPRYVSRGGIKLEKALINFGLRDLTGMVCVDVGASTGGFTDCLLQHSAKKVFAVDVGYGQLQSKLRNDPRVVNMERTNVKNITSFPDRLDLVVIDASFISLKTILPKVKNWKNKERMNIIALVKPQFEAGKKEAAKGKGVIRDEDTRLKILEDVINFAKHQGFTFYQYIESPIQGPKGNKEFLAHFEV